jgi:CBS domain-containing protein
MQVIEILRLKGHEVVSLPSDTSLADAAKLLAHKCIGAVVVSEGQGGITGILSERDLVRALGAEGAAALALPVSRFMTRTVVTCQERDTVEGLMEMMTRGHFRHVPVLDEMGHLCGLVSIGDVVKAHIAETAREASNLRQYISAG